MYVQAWFDRVARGRTAHVPLFLATRDPDPRAIIGYPGYPDIDSRERFKEALLEVLLCLRLFSAI